MSVLPQADGYSRPLGVGRPVVLPRRVIHLEKSGPAFENAMLPMPVVNQLGASLVAQTLVAAGDVLSAIRRTCFIDLIPAWQRLLTVANVTPREGIRYARGRHFWVECAESVEMALTYAEHDTALTKWTLVNMLIYGEVERQLPKTQENLDWWAAQQDAVMVAHLTERLHAYKAFLGGAR